MLVNLAQPRPRAEPATDFGDVFGEAVEAGLVRGRVSQDLQHPLRNARSRSIRGCRAPIKTPVMVRIPGNFPRPRASQRC